MTVVASNFARSPNDLYETEPWATHALLRRFPSVRGRKIWEPAAGNHKIADVLRSEGADVRTSDIIVHNRQHDFLADFLGTDDGMHRAAQWDIVTNPPYGPHNRDAAKFARLALERTSGWVALLLTAKFDFGKTRRDLFADNPRFAFKIALVDRIQWFPGDIGTEDHAWYVWGPLFQPQPPRLLYEGK
jgi:hypothetical protein